ncbi:hypothetical protein K1719_004492 [Acacia pycnantha]|nr:hypothetical protein K1719_004492 [Acacia pycnantha]
MTKTEAYEHMKVKYNTHLNMKKVINALEKAKKSREGSEKEQFGNIRLYLSELLRSNPGSTCGLQVVPQTVPQAPPVFNRMYICLDARKKGFKVVKQKTIGNGFDPTGRRLGDHVVYGWNFISDQQKEVMPRAHHRLRVQHVWKNFMKQWRDKQLRALLWECARCTTIPKFERTMQKLKALNEAAWKYLANIELEHGLRHIIAMGLSVTTSPTMCLSTQAGFRNSEGEDSTSTTEKVGEHKNSQQCPDSYWIGNLVQDMYEVSGRGEKVGVNLTNHTCACNFWQLTSAPCEHAIAAIAHKNEARENYVHRWLTMDALHATYEHTRIQSIPGSIGLHRMNPNQYLHHRKDHQADPKT